MSEIIEVLTTDYLGTFTCNNAVNFVSVTQNATPTQAFINGAGYSKFSMQDNFSILSITPILPHGYIFANLPLTGGSYFQPRFRLGVIDTAFPSTLLLLKCLSADGSIHLPFANYELSLGVFQNVLELSPTLAAATTFQIKANVLSTSAGTANISMLGSPASMNTVVLPLCLQLKILHTLPMVS
jgi:hypothetical protein